MHRLIVAAFALGVVGSSLAAPRDNAFSPSSTIARSGPGDKNCVMPVYPDNAVRFSQPPALTLAYLIDAKGAVLDGRIVSSSGWRKLDNIALVALAKCAFPRQKEKAWVEMKYVFELE
jgi:TonB family protein